MSLKKRIITMALSVFVLIFLVFTVVFVLAQRTLQAKTVESLQYSTQEMATSVDNVLFNLHASSELYADDTRIAEYVDRVYPDTELAQAQKMSAIRYIVNACFASYNHNFNSYQIDLIYNIRTQQLFNVSSPDGGPMGSEIQASLLAYQVADKAKLSQYYCYGLVDNIYTNSNAATLTADYVNYHLPQGEALTDEMRRQLAIRADTVLLTSRRVYSAKAKGYRYVHVFALPEYRIWRSYQPLAQSVGATVYILQDNGSLISSSDIDAVQIRQAPEELVSAVLQRTEDNFELTLAGSAYYVSVMESTLEGNAPGSRWVTVQLVAKSTVTQSLMQQYFVFFAVLIVCAFAAGLMLIYMYRQLMNPLDKLGEAMQEVDTGNLNAYLAQPQNHSEMSLMIGRYNRMLQSINRNLDEKLKHEKRSKQLDMQVLTSQINPHFLYNTLETIVWKANAAGCPDIAKTASSLGKMYRISVNGGQAWSTLGREIEHVASYITIQTARYEGQFTYELSVQHTWLERVRVPKIILQPLVENVFLYAMPEANKVVNIRLAIRQVNEFVVIDVLDNGVGMPSARLAQVRRQLVTGGVVAHSQANARKSTGIGLHNIYARLDMYMGVENGLHINSHHNFGTRCRIKLPLNKVELG